MTSHTQVGDALELRTFAATSFPGGSFDDASLVRAGIKPRASVVMAGVMFSFGFFEW
eukprot:CAMPEP_0185753830 /NCGR_PEP_ID=MMETSP1174-20130828/12533_1 /TAXON_ID=35687 /ORGANISM="Dictyocha speculum, Strain CCMP1381" /LENGTH=56 /DNA_ID=CAMNT_0028431841 /DNA_START=199 /DNA_END=366 /DNA_ORIENTATION=-